MTAAAVEYRPYPRNPDYLVGSDGTVWTQFVGRTLEKTGTWRQVNVTEWRAGVYPCVFIRGLRAISIGQIVLETFVGPKPFPTDQCLHFPDRNPQNNAVDNLRWGTCKENHSDRDKHGTTARGERHGSAKLTDADVYEILKAYAEVKAGTRPQYGWMMPFVKKHGITKRILTLIKNRELWTHVTYP